MIKVESSKNQGPLPLWSKKGFRNFSSTIDDPTIGFFHHDIAQSITETREIRKSIKRKIKYFFHIGLGGSSLGPEMLIKALNKTDTEFIFLNNIDPDLIKGQLSPLKLKESLFYIVSKSGSTAETLAITSVVIQALNKMGINDHELKDYLVFCTDPTRGDLRNFAESENFLCLNIPSNIGGRFSVFTSVGLLPALFANIPIEDFELGIKDFKSEYLKQGQSFIWGQLSEQLSQSYRQESIDQTVVMPYSSLLKEFSSWFVQLWAESLGKKDIGLTPIAAYGATDQHSQVQLFMQGPKNKYIFFIEILSHDQDFPIDFNISLPALEKMKGLTLGTLLTAELRGTEKALQEQDRPFTTVKLPSLDTYHLGQLCFAFQCLTVMLGLELKINPFNQPGVEAGKRFAWQWIDDLSR